MILRDFELTAIDPELLVINKPIPWAIYDEFGKLLMNKGSVLRSERQIAILISVGYFVKDEYKASSSELPLPVKFTGKINPFSEFDDLAVKLKEIYTTLESEQPLTGRRLTNRLVDIITIIQGLVKYDPDALLGAIHLNSINSYSVLHSLQIAVLTEIVLNKLQAQQATRLSTLAAALTANLGMNPYQDRLNQQKAPLTAKQREVVNRHPLQAKQKLEALGIEDKLWLELVVQHHERLDGSGYPNQLKDKEIRHEARIIALADIYSAMLTNQVYRKPIQHKDVMRELFTQRGIQLDDKLTLLFLNELGFYPPGLFVRLNNGELAAVIGRTKDAKAPLVASIKKADGNFFLSPRRRNTVSPQFSIVSTASEEDKFNINPSTLWGINIIKAVPAIRVDLSSIADLI